MNARKQTLRRTLAIGAGVLVLALGAAAWSLWPKVEDIPEQLEEIPQEVSIADIELPAQGPLEALRLGDLQGKKVFLLIEGRESMSGGEGKLLRRALHRWQLPEDVVGFAIGEAPAGAAVMKGKIEREFVGPMREELRWPVYVDFGETLSAAFSLPKGHLGLVILDERGEPIVRHAGDVDASELEEIREALGATEPEPGPPAPDFAVGELDERACEGRSCVLVFLDQKVRRDEIPGLEEGGFEGDMKQVFDQIKKPSVRLARVLATDWQGDEATARIRGAVVGEAEGWTVDGWSFVPDAGEAAALRERFGVEDGQAAMVIVDDEGRLAFAESGRIPFWKLSLAADLLGIEPKEYGQRRDEAQAEPG
ncbi:hypothetical protein G6O69_10435 [Pseudenhygromyxa sp. WMMC2535]|uniref:hypothetical protein n=1 Tax=Pseudenhygromyxa sp. WMMC2535 TaxID=2712867 RepID=UPI0015517F74|nr:hypothetical protein [Pseudenhygromyxa sp. WMMC2535]NVB38248.1 hypothetical protein [Pseudenhygromyxa sp. WMMC2535]